VDVISVGPPLSVVLPTRSLGS